MNWMLSHRADKLALPLADAHYNRQKPGTPQFVPPGRCAVFLTEDLTALWVTSWPFAQYVKHEWAGAWVNSCFRNTGTVLSSELIREAVAATRWFYGDPPEQGFITFIDRSQVRRKRDFGRCYRKAGWSVRGETKGGLLALGLSPEDFPPAAQPIGSQMAFEEAAV